MRLTGHAWYYKTWCSAVISCFFNSSDCCISILRSVHLVIWSLGGPLSHGSPVVVFFDRGHLRFWNFYSTIPVDVVRVKSYMNCLFDPARVVIRVTGNKVSGVKLTSLTTTNLASYVGDPLQLNYYQRLMTGWNLEIYLSLPMSSFLILPKPLTASPMSGCF